MKNVLLIAIIGVALESVSSLYWLLVDVRLFTFEETFSKVFRPVYFLSDLALITFFVYLFKKQPKT
jgi:hypothetical protein